VVLVDTAGRNELNRNLMDEMKKIVRVTKPDLVIFVGDALAGNAIIEQARQFNEAVKIAPILFVGVGQGYDDLIPFDEKWILEKIFGE